MKCPPDLKLILGKYINVPFGELFAKYLTITCPSGQVVLKNKKTNLYSVTQLFHLSNWIHSI